MNFEPLFDKHKVGPRFGLQGSFTRAFDTFGDSQNVTAFIRWLRRANNCERQVTCIRNFKRVRANIFKLDYKVVLTFIACWVFLFVLDVFTHPVEGHKKATIVDDF